MADTPRCRFNVVRWAKDLKPANSIDFKYMSLNDRTLDNYRHPDKAKNTIFGILATRDHNMLGLGLSYW